MLDDDEKIMGRFRLRIREWFRPSATDTRHAPYIKGFTMLQKLGEGGMASVFLARQNSTRRLVAIKVMSPHLQAESRWADRFLSEATRLATLSHPNIVPVFDWGASDGTGYIVMEYLRGGNLTHRIGRGQMRLKEAMHITRQIALGLDFAHEKGYVHRDIKPDNILFREDGSPCILDFGIAKDISSHTTHSSQGVPIGTGAYMSPEQAQPGHLSLDGRSDLYSLGIVLYQMLVGHRPFEFRSQDGVSSFLTYLYAHIHTPAPPLPQALSAFQPIIDKLLAKSPSSRFDRGRELSAALTDLEQRLSSDMLERSLMQPAQVDVDRNKLTVDAPVSTEWNQEPPLFGAKRLAGGWLAAILFVVIPSALIWYTHESGMSGNQAMPMPEREAQIPLVAPQVPEKIEPATVVVPAVSGVSSSVETLPVHLQASGTTPASLTTTPESPPLKKAAQVQVSPNPKTMALVQKQPETALKSSSQPAIASRPLPSIKSAVSSPPVIVVTPTTSAPPVVIDNGNSENQASAALKDVAEHAQPNSVDVPSGTALAPNDAIAAPADPSIKPVSVEDEKLQKKKLRAFGSF